MAFRRMDTVHRRIDQAYEATRSFLRDRDLLGDTPTADGSGKGVS